MFDCQMLNSVNGVFAVLANDHLHFQFQSARRSPTFWHDQNVGLAERRHDFQPKRVGLVRISGKINRFFQELQKLATLPQNSC